jgi:hypothetical protein
MKFLFQISIPLFLCLGACTKEKNNVQQAGTNLSRIVEGTDPDITKDTVYLISYNSSNNISVILDSMKQDSLVASYDALGNLTAINNIGSFSLGNASFIYDENGLLTEINYGVKGSENQYLFEYSNGAVSKKSRYLNYDAGSPLLLLNYDIYTVSDGNITEMKEYSASGSLYSTTTFAYGTQANPFKLLGLMNFGNRLGTNDIANFETYFNKNIQTGFLTNGSNVMSLLTFDSQQKPTKIITDDLIDDWLLTWQFFYD